MNERLIHFLDNTHILVEEQNGFRKNRSCQDHLFVLSAIVRYRIGAKVSTCCCFVDFQAAFDSLDRILMIYALEQLGIDGKFLTLLKAMYSDSKGAVKVKMEIWGGSAH